MAHWLQIIHYNDHNKMLDRKVKKELDRKKSDEEEAFKEKRREASRVSYN